MLAQNFMTAEELGISEVEHETLRKTLSMFERGEVPKEKFRMAVIGNPECGTPGCILGWARTINKAIFITSEWGSAENLFIRPIRLQRLPASPADAAAALRNYLTTGEPRWDEVLSAD